MPCCSSGVEFFSRAVGVCVSQWFFVFCLALPDLICHWLDYTFDVDAIALIFGIAFCVILLVCILQLFFMWKCYKQALVESTERIEFSGPAYKCIRCCSIGVPFFKDFPRYAVQLRLTVERFRYFDFIFGGAACVYARLSGLMFYNTRADGASSTAVRQIVLEQELLIAVDRMNMAAFFCNFLVPFAILSWYSVRVHVGSCSLIGRRTRRPIQNCKPLPTRN